MKMKCNAWLVIFTLLVIGGVNWGLVGLGYFIGQDINLVSMIFGAGSTLEAVIYIVVGLAAVLAVGHLRCKCNKKCSCTDSGCSHCKV